MNILTARALKTACCVGPEDPEAESVGRLYLLGISRECGRRILSQEATGPPIEDHEKRILNRLTSCFSSALTGGLKQEVQARRAAAKPLINSLAEQLTKFQNLQP